MCLPRTVRVLEPDALPIVQEQGWFAQNDWNRGFMLEQDDIPDNIEEDLWSDENAPNDFGEYGLLGPDDIERMWNVYRGVERPRDDDDWYACWKYSTDSLFYVTGLTYEFEQWESAWPDSDDSSVDE